MAVVPTHSVEAAGLAPKLPLRLGRYVLFCELGAGGMATVYLAQVRLSAGMEKLVALKTIHRHLARQDEFVAMFLDEARIAAQVNHPNVCSTFDFGKVADTYYIAMEYLVGQPLVDVVNRIAHHPEPALLEVLPYLAARIIADACEGLHAAHETKQADGRPLGIVHRDVSPQNLFVTYEGTIKVVDFGCAKALQRVSQTNTGMLKGKVSYASPEQLQADEVDALTDVWALGVCLHEILSLRPLFYRPEGAMRTAAAILGEEIPRADQHEWVPKAIASIADRALSRDPAERYASARDLGRALRTFMTDAGVTLESAEVAEWMGYLFDGRQAELLRMQQEIQAMDESRIPAWSRLESYGEPAGGGSAEARDPGEAPAVPQLASGMASGLVRTPDRPEDAEKTPRSGHPRVPAAEPALLTENERRLVGLAPPGYRGVGWLLGVLATAASAWVAMALLVMPDVRESSAPPNPVASGEPSGVALPSSPDGPAPPDRPDSTRVAGRAKERALGERRSRRARTASAAEQSTPVRTHRPNDALPSRSAGTSSGLLDPAPVDPAPVGSAPVDPAPVDSALVDSALVDLAPVDSAPADPAPVGSALVDPAAALGRTGTLRLVAHGGWADVWIDDEPHGRTPVVTELPEGYHRVRIVPFGQGPPQTERVLILPDSSRVLDLEIPAPHSPSLR